MKRRTLLAGVAAGAVGLSGCLADGDDGNATDDETADGGDGTTDGGNGDRSSNGGDGGNVSNGGDDERSSDDGDNSSDSGGGDDPPSVTDGSIRTTETSCGSSDAPRASAERTDGQVVVEGTISASTPCHDAVLDAVEVRNDRLAVTVNVDQEEGVCQMCIGAIEYRATVTVSNVDGLHGATVEHVDGDEYETNWETSGEDSS